MAAALPPPARHKAAVCCASGGDSYLYCLQTPIMASKLLRPAEHCGAEPADDLLCALCHSLFHGPVTTPCRHTYCSFF